MVWQYIQIIIHALWKYAARRFAYVRNGTWIMHRYQTGHLLLGETILLCEEKRKKLVLAERRSAEKKAAKKLRAEQIYASKNKGNALESDSPQQEEQGDNYVRQDD